ncbi:MAG: hypothetical protein ACLQUY_16930 [Ktedonobacterales bacterium]
MRICQTCGEDWPEALSKEGDLCRNHAVQSGLSLERYREIISHCPTCGRADVPAQWHHFASKRQQDCPVALKPLGILLCLNCHGILTERQSSGWHPSWKAEDHSVRCTVQGVYDVLWLWWAALGRAAEGARHAQLVQNPGVCHSSIIAWSVP